VDEFLRKLRMGFRDIDQLQISASIGVTRMVTSPICNPRLHGRHAAMGFAEEASRDPWYDDPDKALNEIMDAVEVLAWCARDTYVISNNQRRGAGRQA
jgi:hypothetical protein